MSGRLSADRVRIRIDATGADAVLDACLDMAPGRSLAIAGESGSGKTTLVHALFGYVRAGLTALEGTVQTGAGGSAPLVLNIRRSAAFGVVRGRVLGLMPQSADAVLDPIMPIGAQLAETHRVHWGARRGSQAGAEAIAALLSELGFPRPEHVLRRYAHEVSGGQRQRIALAMALIPEPELLVMDEATTDLDVITQQQVLDHIKRAQERRGFGLVAVSHDLRVLRQICDDLLVMYRGAVVESGPIASVFERPRHPYTRELLQRFRLGVSAAGAKQSVSDGDGAPWGPGCAYKLQCPLAGERCAVAPPALRAEPGHRARCWHADLVPPPDATAPTAQRNGRGMDADAGALLLQVRGLCASYRSGMLARRWHPVLDNVSLDVHAGEVVGIVGESGSGKTTLARVIVGVHAADAGEVTLDGTLLTQRAAARPLAVRRQLQIIFQNPGNALNPALRVRDVLARRIRVFERRRGREAAARTEELLRAVGLPPSFADRWCRQLSGGEKQRVAIARALAGEPRLIVCDEIVSSLDVLAQARILALLRDLRDRLGLALIFISHDIGVVAGLADNIVVFQSGRICEQGPAGSLVRAPRHEYTRQLLDSALL